MKQGRFCEAEPLLADAVPRWQQQYPETSLPGRSMKIYAECLLKLGRYGMAESVLLEARQSLSERKGETNPFTIDATKLLIELYDAWGKPVEADRWQTKLLTSIPDTESDVFGMTEDTPP